MSDNGAYDLIPQRSVLDRTLRAQIIDVDYENGFVICNYDGQPSGGKYVTVAPLWMSFPQTGGAAWGRFMPQRSDVVKLTFGYDDRPHIVGFDVEAGERGVADGRVGWSQLNKLYASAVDNPSKKVRVTKNDTTTEVGIARYGKFIPLKPGEFDFMSSGGGYIRGSDSGKLYLAGGGASISLIKNELLISTMSQLLTNQSDDSLFRFGQVRRINSTSKLNVITSSDTDGLNKEFNVLLKTTAEKDKSKDLASLYLGNVVDETGAVIKVDKDLRYLLRAHDADGAKVHESSIDLAGQYVESSKAEHIINAKMTKIQGVDGSPKAEHPLILSNTYKDKETQMVADLVKQVKALADALDALCKVVGTAPAAVGPVIPYAAALATGAQSTSAMIILMKAQIDLVSTQFEQDWPSCQSKIAKTG